MTEKRDVTALPLGERFRSWWVVYPRYWKFRVAYAVFGERLAGWYFGRKRRKA